MKIGLNVVVIAPEALVEVSVTAERLGYESVWQASMSPSLRPPTTTLPDDTAGGRCTVPTRCSWSRLCCCRIWQRPPPERLAEAGVNRVVVTPFGDPASPPFPGTVSAKAAVSDMQRYAESGARDPTGRQG